MKRKSIAFLAVFVLAGVAGASYLNVGWDGIRIGDPQVAGQGTKFKLLELHSLSFAGDTSATAPSDAGAIYQAIATFASASDDPGKITASVAGGTLTVTTSNATTGTCSVVVFGQ